MRPATVGWRGRLFAVLVSLLLLGASVAPVAAQHATAQDDEPPLDERGITNVRVSGDAVVLTQNNTTYVWNNASLSVRVVVQPYRDDDTYLLCLNATQNGSTVREYGCTRNHRSSVYSTQFGLERLGLNATGPTVLNVTLTSDNHTDAGHVTVTVLTREGDFDGDGLSNEKELKYNSSINGTDTDHDGLTDGNEVLAYDTSPTANDTDSDGLRDAIEISKGTEPRDKDTDGDLIYDGREVNKFGTDPKDNDTDDDGLLDAAELHQYETDPNLEDSDEDGLTDPQEVNEVFGYDTDPTVADTDGDGFTDGEEIRAGSNPTNPSSQPPGTGTPPGDDGVRADTPLMFLWAGLGVAVALGVGLVLYTQRRPSGKSLPDADALENSATSVGSGEAASQPDPELLPPDERVHLLLDEHGGRLKQSEVVDLTDWSKAKVSRTLTEMEENGAIERIRIGRENVVTSPAAASD